MKARSTGVTLRVERSLLREGARRVAGMDEVGRGALAGPVTVGVVVIDAGTPAGPAGVRDSKLLSARQRQVLVEPIRRWCAGWGVGHASADEIDAAGIMEALRLAGRRALTQAHARVDGEIDTVLLDGSHDWLSAAGQPTLFDDDWRAPRTVTKVKADLTCMAVAAASILAKTERDELMAGLHSEYPDFGWDANKGYSSPQHIEALRSVGPSAQHRTSWSLPT